MEIEKYITHIKDFPIKGITYCDIIPMFNNPDVWHYIVDELAEKIAPYNPDVLVGLDARGFILASALAYKMNIGFNLIRKKGKLPGKVHQVKYTLEYGEEIFEVQDNGNCKNKNVVIVDDILATGGTLAAAEKLISMLKGNIVAHCCILQISDLHGNKKLSKDVITLIKE